MNFRLVAFSNFKMQMGWVFFKNIKGFLHPKIMCGQSSVKKLESSKSIETK